MRQLFAERRDIFQSSLEALARDGNAESETTAGPLKWDGKAAKAETELLVVYGVSLAPDLLQLFFKFLRCRNRVPGQCDQRIRCQVFIRALSACERKQELA